LCTDLTEGIEAFTDGLWHSVSIDVLATQGSKPGRVEVTVDGQPDISERQLTFSSASKFYIGGMFTFLQGRRNRRDGQNLYVFYVLNKIYRFVNSPEVFVWFSVRGVARNLFGGINFFGEVQNFNTHVQ